MMALPPWTLRTTASRSRIRALLTSAPRRQPLHLNRGGEADVLGGVAEGELAQVDAGHHAAYQIDNEWSMARHSSYENSLCNLMAFAHNRDFRRYPKGRTFSREQLLQLKPQHIHNWLAKRAFGKVLFSIESGDRPIHARSSSLEFQKRL